MRNWIVLSTLCSLLLCISCKGNKKTIIPQDMKTQISYLVNKKITFPEDICDAETLDSLLETKFKIVAYFDSTGCMECKLSLDEWDLKIREMKNEKNLSFIFIVHYNNPEVISMLRKRHQFNNPIFVDKKNSFFSTNKIAPRHTYQVFLLDENNRIKIIGNPILNDKLWELYKKEINKR